MKKYTVGEQGPERIVRSQVVVVRAARWRYIFWTLFIGIPVAFVVSGLWNGH